MKNHKQFRCRKIPLETINKSPECKMTGEQTEGPVGFTARVERQHHRGKDDIDEKRGEGDCRINTHKPRINLWKSLQVTVTGICSQTITLNKQGWMFDRNTFPPFLFIHVPSLFCDSVPLGTSKVSTWLQSHCYSRQTDLT